jgi:ubiquinol-cytochrome c reductase cytochrome b subunit
VSGVLLMLFYTPSSDLVSYRGGYRPLDGVEMSKAYRSVIDLSFAVPGGLLLRQVHHWAALLLPASVTMQLVVAFFTAGFRRPRQWAWLVLVGIFLLVLVAGWSGYALPDDMLAGTGLRIVEGIMVGIPVVGAWLSAMLFGGEFPGTVIEHLYPIHLLASVALVGLVALRARMSWVHRPAQFPGLGRTERNVVGIPMYPDAAARAVGLAGSVAGILVLTGASVTIAPIWNLGPSSPGDASAGSQPDWYTGFLDGALRLVPPGWEISVGGHPLTLAVLIPLAVVGAFVLALAAYPFIENWAVGDRADHGLLQRPRSTPNRTGIGVAGMTFYGVLWAAASADVLAVRFGLSIETVVRTLQVLLVVGPIAGFLIAQRICIGLQQKDAGILAHGYETGRIVRLPGGEYVEVHAPVDGEEHARLANVEGRPVVDLEPDDRGRVPIVAHARAFVGGALVGQPPKGDPSDEDRGALERRVD